jgi:hypothetical protein
LILLRTFCAVSINAALVTASGREKATLPEVAEGHSGVSAARRTN